MPSNILSADTSFPQFTENMSGDEKLNTVTNYLYMLLEQLRYTLANLGESNFNPTELETIGKRISLYATDGLKLRVGGDDKETIIELTNNGTVISSEKIDITGVVTFTSLSGSGTTTINGDNITTGSISGIDFKGLLTTSGTSKGQFLLYYGDYSPANVAGGFRLDVDPSQPVGQATRRLYVFTETVSGVAFVLKLESAGAMSLTSHGDMYLLANRSNIYIEAQTADADTVEKVIRLNAAGGVYVNGTKIG